MNGRDEPSEVSSPHAIEARASRVRRIVAGVAAVLVLASVPAVGLSRFASANEGVLEQTKHELKHSKHELQEAKDKYRAQTRKIRALQRVMNRLATRWRGQCACGEFSPWCKLACRRIEGGCSTSPAPILSPLFASPSPPAQPARRLPTVDARCVRSSRCGSPRRVRRIPTPRASGWRGSR